jgi:arginase
MSNTIKIIEITSELGAGTRGASLGVGALRTAAYNKKLSLFRKYPSLAVPDFNTHLFSETGTPGAIRIQYIEQQFGLIIDSIKKTLNSDEFPFVLAGDHSTAAATIAGIQQTYPEKKLGVIWVDAHGDLHSPYTSPTGNVHGMPLAIACGIDNKECKVRDVTDKALEHWENVKGMAGKNLNPDNLVFIGVRDTEKPEDELIKKLNIKNFTVPEVIESGGESIAKQSLEILKNCDMLYVSFDVDSMDPEETSHGTGTPVANGIPITEVTELLKTLCSSSKLVCFETVEINPTLDEKKNRMAEVAVTILEELSVVIASRN